MFAALTFIVVVVAARGRVARGLEPGVPCARTVRPVAKLSLCTMVHVPLDIRLNRRFDGYSSEPTIRPKEGRIVHRLHAVYLHGHQRVGLGAGRPLRPARIHTVELLSERLDAVRRPLSVASNHRVLNIGLTFL